jgi:putative membrane protein
MNRRQLLVAGAAVAAVPATLGPARAQGLAQSLDDGDIPSQMGTGAAGGPVAEPVPFEPGALDGIDPGLHDMILLGNYSKQASRLAIGAVQSQALRQFATLEIAEQEALALAFGAADAPLMVTPEHAEALVRMRAGMNDGAYLAAQIDAHRQALALAQGYVTAGEDPVALGAAIVSVPAIESHLSMLALIRDATM